MREPREEPTLAHPTQAAGAYLEPLLRGRRVAVLGDATLPVVNDLVERGARLVHVYDPDAGRVAVATARRAGEGTRPGRPVVAQLSDDLGVRDGAFDLVFVPDLSEFDDAAEIVRRSKRMVSPTGTVVFASPNPEAERHLLPPSRSAGRALGYYELYDAISLQFSEVKMLGQAPFVGYALVDFSEAEPDVSIDTSALAEPEAPEWYVVVAGERALELEAYALVALPLAGVAGVLAEGPETPRQPTDTGKPLRDLEVLLAEAQARISVLGTENEKLSHALAQSVREGRSFDQVSLRATELEREADGLRRQARSLEERLEIETGRAEGFANDLRVAQGELAKARAAHEHALRFEKQLAEARARVAELEATISAMDPPTLRSKEMQQQRIQNLEAQRAELEAKLEAEAKRAHQLELTLAEAERDRDLARRGLDEAKAKVTAAGTKAAADKAELSRLTAREADLIESLRDAEARVFDPSALEAELVVEREKVAPLEEEIARLEHALRERGHDVLRVQRELREAERIGKELLFELSSAWGSGGGGGTGSGGALEGRGGSAGGSGPRAPEAMSATAASTDVASVVLAERAAKAEADVIALGWKAAQLERELRRLTAERAVAATGSTESKKTRELSAAVAAAQREIARLRANGSDGEAESRGALAEQAVLLQQIAAERSAGLSREER